VPAELGVCAFGCVSSWGMTGRCREGAQGQSQALAPMLKGLHDESCADAATLDALSDGTLVDEHGQPLVFRRRRLQESYAKKHALAIALGTVLSFMAVKLGEAACFWWDGGGNGKPPRAVLLVSGAYACTFNRCRGNVCRRGRPCERSRSAAPAGDTMRCCVRSNVRLLAGAAVVAGSQAATDG